MYLFCDNCGIKSMNVNGAPSLVEMYVEENQLTSLDVSSLTQLDVLACRDNQLTSLNLKGAERLGYLSCQNNRLKELDVSTNPRLKLLTAYGNYITEIDVSALEDLDGLMYEDREGKHEVILDKEKKVLLYDGQAEPVPDKVIKVGEKITLKFKKKIGGIGYTDDSIIETKVKKKKNLVVKGVAPGITEIVVSDKKDRTLGTFVIRVE
jgi:Leucine-rich repeat (LRR) protein